MTQNTQPVLLTSKELADRWKLSERTIINMRSENRGVPATKLGRSVRYLLSDVEAFEAQNKQAIFAE